MRFLANYYRGTFAVGVQVWHLFFGITGGTGGHGTTAGVQLGVWVA